MSHLGTLRLSCPQEVLALRDLGKSTGAPQSPPSGINSRAPGPGAQLRRPASREDRGHQTVNGNNVENSATSGAFAAHLLT